MAGEKERDHEQQERTTRRDLEPGFRHSRQWYTQYSAGDFDDGDRWDTPRHRRNIIHRKAVVATCVMLMVVLGIGTALAVTHGGGGVAGDHGNGVATRGTPPSQNAVLQSRGLPAGIPDYFAFGVMNAPNDVALLDDMRSRNGTAWDYRYQYLDGGVNTGKGWETWNSPTGAFATLYMQESANHHYIPAFVYYEMRQSNGSCGACTESYADLSNLNNPSVMAAYYANWRLLMRNIGSFGGPVLVVVEPDLWGFMQLAALSQGNTATVVHASVASSGDPDVAGLPDTAQGFAWALLRIRDRYAPNAVLTLHVSEWSTTTDIGSNTSPTLDVHRAAQQTSQFLLSVGLSGNPSGISTWDLLSSDVADRDSGQGAAWWDPTNTVYPNFARYISFIGDITRATGKKVVMWQVPEGNQYFDTENNLDHHTQDNRAAYILAHVADFARAGVIGVLFGPGNGGTSIDDTAHDGITNPAPIASFECNACNTHISTFPDDDGGYLRLFVGAYYRHGPLQLANPNAWTPASVSSASATAPPVPPGGCAGPPAVSIGGTTATPEPAHVGQTETFAAYVTANCDTTALVYIEVSIPGKRITQVSRDDVHFKAGQPEQVTISGVLSAGTAPGSYQIKVGVFAAGWGAQYAWNNAAGTITVQ